jgi:hypothetical protein
MFASSDSDSDQWMSFVRNYLEGQVDEQEYFHWMRQFVGIFQVSRYLDAYIELFLSITRVARPFALTEITRPMASSMFQGGGIEAPPLCRVLGLGSCFIVRELVRLKLLSNEMAHRHCFVPTKRVRDTFDMLGCEGLDIQAEKWSISPQIHEFVVQHLGSTDATFCHDFDIPFHFIAEDARLQQRFFERGVLGEGDDEGEWSGVHL